jgi:hypothetical protein
MTETSPSNALKHGAFSEVLILPGEDPAAYEKLKKSLFAEYNVSGCPEELTMTSIAKTMWQLQRLGIYEHVQYLRARGRPQSFANGPRSIEEAINQIRTKLGLRNDSASDAPTVPEQPKEKSNDELLLELGNLVTLDHLDKELDVENKLMVKLDRLFKRFFQIKAMKPLMGLVEPPAPALASTTPVLELTATEASKTSDEPGHSTEPEAGTTESVKSEVV